MSRALLVVLAVAALGQRAAHAEHLPVRTFTTADGLASARIMALVRDHRGFLWFATHEGLSRFDGQRFETFGPADGLPALDCTALLEASDGVLWVGTVAGVARFDPSAPAPAPRFARVAAAGDAAVQALFEDRAHQLWLGGFDGLWSLGRAGAPPEPRRVAFTADGGPYVDAITEDASGALWLGTHRGVVRRSPDGHSEHYRFAARGVSDDRVLSIHADRAGRIWVGAIESGLVALVPPAPGTPLLAADDTLWDAGRRGGPAHASDGELRLPTRPGEIVHYGVDDGFVDHGVRRGICQDVRGDLYFGGTSLVRFDGHRFAILDGRRGFPDDSVAACAEDADGNLWFGGDIAGAVELLRHGFVTYGLADGLAGVRINGISQGPDDAIYVTAWRGWHVLHRLDGERLVAVQPALPPGEQGGAWGWGQVGFLDRDRRWWYATQFGLARYPEVARLEDLAHTLPRYWRRGDGLPGRDIWRLYQDRRGDVWVATLSDVGLARWDRATDTLAPVVDPALPADAVDAFAEDAHGGLWLGYGDGRVARVDLTTRRVTRVLGPADGLIDGAVQALLLDARGRLWVAADGGLARLDDPLAPQPAPRRYTTQSGLSSVSATALVDDARGRIYVGTNRGIDRIDPTTGAIDHFTLADGLAQEYVDAAFRDRSGDLWFGSHGGLSRLVPDDPPPAPPAPVYVMALRAGGVARAIAPGGDRAPPALALPYDIGAIDLAVASPSFAAGHAPRLQYRLDESEPWLAFGGGELHLPRLAPGDYHLELRAAFDGGLASAVTSVDLAIAAPLWRQTWFRLLVAAALVALGYAAYRRRVAHLLALERVRSRLASDLHDDLGANLSRIALLSDLAARRASGGDGVGDVVGDIGRSARALVDAASDIVWSTDPRRDDLGSLIARLRAFAGDVLDARGVRWSFDTPADPDRVALDPDARRHLYLVVKEAITNAARHADASNVAITVRVHGARLEAIVEDDGRGVAAARATPTRGGNGLRNMRTRAELIGGSLTVGPGARGGTRITLRVPVRA